MRYYLDTEFDGFGGELISLALISHDGAKELYCVSEDIVVATDPWVAKNVMPKLWDEMQGFGGEVFHGPLVGFGHAIRRFLSQDANPDIVFDWPDDGALFAKSLLTAPGYMVNMDAFTLPFIRCRGWSTADDSAVPHHALHDARALREYFLRNT